MMGIKKNRLCEAAEIIMYWSYAVFVARLILLVIIPQEQSVHDSTACMLLITAIIALLSALATAMLSDTSEKENDID